MLFKPSSNLTADSLNLKRDLIMILVWRAEITDIIPSDSQSGKNYEEEGEKSERGLLTGLLLLGLAGLVTTAAEGNPHDQTIGRKKF